MDISHWDAAIHYGIKLAQYFDQTRSSNAISRRSLPLCSFALRLRNTKVPVWTHESIGYPKMDISHWDAAIHYGIKLAKYCDQTRFCNVIHGDRPLCAHLPLLPVLCYRITLSIAVILAGNTLTTSVIVKTFKDICGSFTSTSIFELLVVVYPILLL